jgi:hypothetical protein
LEAHRCAEAGKPAPAILGRLCRCRLPWASLHRLRKLILDLDSKLPRCRRLYRVIRFLRHLACEAWIATAALWAFLIASLMWSGM